jgi:large subunit ribosomal protein L19
MRMNLIENLERAHLKPRVSEFRVGDVIRVKAKVVEGGRERLQAFEGIVIARDGGGSNETFTVRRVVAGEGVEKIFPLHSPWVESIEVLQGSHVRRAKLYFLRDRTGKKARLRRKMGIQRGWTTFIEEAGGEVATASEAAELEAAKTAEATAAEAQSAGAEGPKEEKG